MPRSHQKIGKNTDMHGNVHEIEMILKAREYDRMEAQYSCVINYCESRRVKRIKIGMLSKNHKE